MRPFWSCLRTLLTLASLAWAMAAWAQAEDRIAFVIGNANYPGGAGLSNPVNDANAIQGFLKNHGFETIQTNDLSSKQIPALRQQIEKRITRNSVLFFYYAGHGVQLDGRNYLVSVDASTSSRDALSDESLYLGDILAAIEKKRPKLAVVILDACRDNPFKADKSVKANSGLARVDPPSSTVVFYATRPGGVASDGTQGNGLFTQALIKEFDVKDVPLEVAFRRISTQVYKSSKGEQEPWIEGVIREEFIFHQDASRPLAAAPVPAPELAPAGSSPMVAAETPAPVQALNAPPVLAVAPISWSDALSQLRSLTKAPPKETELGTQFACHDAGCTPYKQWAANLKDPQELDKVKALLRAIPHNTKIKTCEFDLSTNQCLHEDLHFTHFNLFMLFNKGYVAGFDVIDPKLTKSGGLTFNAEVHGGSQWLGSGKVGVNCVRPDARLEFLNDRIDLVIARLLCVGFSVSTGKVEFDILMADVQNMVFIAKWRLSMFAGVAGGTGSGITRISLAR